MTIVPMLGGLAIIVALVVYQYRAKRPLLTVRTMLTSSIPVAGIAVALFAAAASVSATALTVERPGRALQPAAHRGALPPEVGGAVVTAVVLGRVITEARAALPPLGRHGHRWRPG